MKTIYLTQGKSTIIDDDFCSNYKWYFMSNGYAATRPWNKKTKSYSTIYLHRLITGARDNELVDHINGDKLNNLRSNLRICTHKENIRNGKLRSNNKSGFTGVFYCAQKSKWCARITVDDKAIHLGFYEDAKIAGEKYREAAVMYFGDFSRYK